MMPAATIIFTRRPAPPRDMNGERYRHASKKDHGVVVGGLAGLIEHRRRDDCGCPAEERDRDRAEQTALGLAAMPAGQVSAALRACRHGAATRGVRGRAREDWWAAKGSNLRPSG